ncbi:MAG TPA: DUF5050 domain-containing protein [bacterium]|nr:DUF5050 domain-containing protein [bacterium]HPQ65499.1 DUF5050 domain-containing protein [bacterium]
MELNVSCENNMKTDYVFLPALFITILCISCRAKEGDNKAKQNINLKGTIVYTSIAPNDNGETTQIIEHNIEDINAQGIVITTGTDAKYSQDAKNIVYVRHGNLYIINTDDGITKELCDSPNELMADPSWLPDDTNIVFVGIDIGMNSTIYTINKNGSDMKQIFKSTSNIRSPSWVPGGNEIVYSSAKLGDYAQIYKYNMQLGTVDQLTNEGASFNPSVSPDGKHIAYVCNGKYSGSSLCIMDINGKNQRCILEGKGYHRDPEWSRDGKILVFSSARKWDWPFAGSEIYAIDVDGQNETQITNTVHGRHDTNERPSWVYGPSCEDWDR